jgi:hypothetical protein
LIICPKSKEILFTENLKKLKEMSGIHRLG